VEEINKDFIKGINFKYVNTIDELIDLAIDKNQVPNPINLIIPADPEKKTEKTS
jgi:hypothetical protein